MTRLCVIDGCGRKHCAQDMCRPHYMRWWRGSRVRPEVPIGDGRKGARKS